MSDRNKADDLEGLVRTTTDSLAQQQQKAEASAAGRPPRSRPRLVLMLILVMVMGIGLIQFKFAPIRFPEDNISLPAPG